MNQEFKNIDDLFQSAFADDSAEVPAFVKANIDKKLESKKSKGGWIWFSSIALLLLISATLFWKLNPNETNLSQTITDSDNYNPTSQTNNTKILSTNSTIPSDKSSDSHVTMNENETELTQQDSDHTKKSVSEYSETVNSGQTETKSNGGDSKSGSDFTTQKSSGKIQQDPTDIGGESITVDQSNSSNERSGTSDQTASSILLPLSARMFEKQESAKMLSPISKTFTTPNPTSASALFGKKDIQAIPFEAREIYNPWMFSATGGMNFSQSKYTSTNPSEEKLYNDSNDDNPGFECNIDVRYRLKNSLTFGTGIALSQLKENYDFFKQTISLDSTLVWSYQDIYEYDTLLDSNIWVGIDSTSTTNYDTTSVTLYNASGTNTATYLHIPFSVGTQIIRNKFRFDFYVMGRFNYLLNASGGYVEDETFNTFSNTNQIYKKWYLDMMIGTAVHYQLFEKLYLTGTFRYRPQIGNLYQGLSFNRSVQSYHIGIGLSWKL